MFIRESGAFLNPLTFRANNPQNVKNSVTGNPIDRKPFPMIKALMILSKSPL
jgi:hypothetical protein